LPPLCGDDVDDTAGDVAVLGAEQTADDLHLAHRLEVEVETEGVGGRIRDVDAVEVVVVGVLRAAVDLRVAAALLVTPGVCSATLW
jgi:hypothetical protein